MDVGLSCNLEGSTATVPCFGWYPNLINFFLIGRAFGFRDFLAHFLSYVGKNYWIIMSYYCPILNCIKIIFVVIPRYGNSELYYGNSWAVSSCSELKFLFSSTEISLKFRNSIKFIHSPKVFARKLNLFLFYDFVTTLHVNQLIGWHVLCLIG